MKINRNKFKKEIEQRLTTLGYRKVILGSSVADTLYLKVIDDQLYLTLGFTYSNFNLGKFTAAFYLSKITDWGSVWDDIPPESYERIGSFLEASERLELLEEEYTKNGVVDSWWDMNDISALDKFLKAVQITEDRFLAQPGMILKVKQSSAVNELSRLSLLVIEEVSNNDDTFNYRFIPKKAKPGIGEEWFKAAERVLILDKGEISSNYVAMLAYDAFRQNEVSV